LSQQYYWISLQSFIVLTKRGSHSEVYNLVLHMGQNFWHKNFYLDSRR